MNPGVRSLAAVAALFAASLLPAHAELDAVGLKKAIETSIASDYPKLDALYKGAVSRVNGFGGDSPR